MQVQKIITRKIIPLTVAIMTGIGASSLKASTINDTFERNEPKKEFVDDSKNDDESKFPWKQNLIAVGALLAIFGLIKMGDIVESKEKKSDTNGATSDTDANNNQLHK